MNVTREYKMNEIEAKKKLAEMAKRRLNKVNVEIATLIRMNEFVPGAVRITELEPLNNILERLDAIYLSMNRIITKE
ncbi:MAG TPA: hypothetical protein DGG95_03175 [Cytophagales bacterium]|nr:hypothetical protein [Cytophagales bacterium]